MGGGQRGQSSIWTQTLPTDSACQRDPDLEVGRGEGEGLGGGATAVSNARAAAVTEGDKERKKERKKKREGREGRGRFFLSVRSPLQSSSVTSRTLRPLDPRTLVNGVNEAVTSRSRALKLQDFRTSGPQDLRSWGPVRSFRLHQSWRKLQEGRKQQHLQVPVKKLHLFFFFFFFIYCCCHARVKPQKDESS